MIYQKIGAEVIKIPGITFIIRVPSSETNGRIAIFEEITDPQIGPALHFHEDQTEIFRILSGKYLMQIGEKKIKADVGDIFVVPPKVPHTFVNISNISAKLEFSFLPAKGIENFFRELPQVVLTKKDHKKIGRVAKSYGTTVVGPPLIIH